MKCDILKMCAVRIIAAYQFSTKYYLWQLLNFDDSECTPSFYDKVLLCDTKLDKYNKIMEG